MHWQAINFRSLSIEKADREALTKANINLPNPEEFSCVHFTDTLT